MPLHKRTTQKFEHHLAPLEGTELLNHQAADGYGLGSESLDRSTWPHEPAQLGKSNYPSARSVEYWYRFDLPTNTTMNILHNEPIETVSTTVKITKKQAVELVRAGQDAYNYYRLEVSRLSFYEIGEPDGSYCGNWRLVFLLNPYITK